MKELRFHRSVYDVAAVDAAIATFERFAQIARSEDGESVVVQITASSPARERRVAGELGNFALGTTIRDLGAR